MMNKPSVIILGLLLISVAAAEEIDRSLDADPDGRVDVSNIAGAITIRGWSRKQVEVTGKLGKNVEELVFERNGDKVTVQVKVPKNSGRGIDSDLYINVPENSSIDVSAVSADIDVADVKGEQHLETVSGDVTTASAGEDIVAGSVSGDVEVSGDGKNGDTQASTVSGDVSLFRVGGTVSAESVTGDVIVDEGSFVRADLSTVNGELIFQSVLLKGGKFSAETVNGDVDVALMGDVSAKFDVSTFNGRIRNCFGPEATRSSKYTPGWSLSFTAGEGDGRVDISTMNGEVSLCRK